MSSKIILFTDLHYGENIINKTKKGINTHGKTDDILLLFKNNIVKYKPYALINLGDLVFGNSKEIKIKRFKKIINLFNGIETNFYHLLGNHEFFLTNKDDIKKETKQLLHFSFIEGGYNHIILDIEHTEFGCKVPNKTINWLKNEIKNTDLPIIIYSHYPITEQKENISYYHKNKPKKSFLMNSKKLKNILKNSNCKLFISGHTHFYYETIIDGIKHITIPSFSEDNNGQPNGKYGILDLKNLSLEIKTVY